MLGTNESVIAQGALAQPANFEVMPTGTADEYKVWVSDPSSTISDAASLNARNIELYNGDTKELELNSFIADTFTTNGTDYHYSHTFMNTSWAFPTIFEDLNSDDSIDTGDEASVLAVDKLEGFFIETTVYNHEIFATIGVNSEAETITTLNDPAYSVEFDDGMAKSVVPVTFTEGSGGSNDWDYYVADIWPLHPGETIRLFDDADGDGVLGTNESVIA